MSDAWPFVLMGVLQAVAIVWICLLVIKGVPTVWAEFKQFVFEVIREVKK